MSQLARTYAQALYQADPGAGEALAETARALMEDAALWQALTSPAVQCREKEGVLARLECLAGRDILLRFYCLLARKGRMELLPGIVEAFQLLALAGRGAARCVMTCAHAPDPQSLERLRRALCALHHKQDIEMDVRVDPALLGGFTLTLEGVTYDKSVRGALKEIQRRMEERRMA